MPDPVSPTPIAAYSGEVPNPSNPATYGVHGRNLWAWEIETLLPGANLLADQAYTNAQAALEAAAAAYINANFKGAWSGLTGALNKPAMVTHSGQRWVLLNNLANVTTSTPGVSADWELFQLPAASGVGFNPAGTSRTETNVQTALAGVANDATAALVDFENPVRNGDFLVAQAGTSFPGITTTPGTHTLDGWLVGHSSAGVVSAYRTVAGVGINKYANWHDVQVTTVDASIGSTDYCIVYQPIEGYDMAIHDGNTFTVSFRVRSSVTGIHTCYLRGAGIAAYYLHEFNILAANVPQFVSFTVVGGLPAAGVLDTTTGIGIELGFVLAAGSSLQGTVGSWQVGSRIASPSQVNCLGTINGVFGVTSVQINPGTTAKNFKRPTYEASLARCQRYYEVLSVQVGEDTAASTRGNGHSWKVEKRVTPNITVANGAGPNSTATVTFSLPGANSKTGVYQSSGTNIGTVGAYGNKLVIGDARLSF